MIIHEEIRLALKVCMVTMYLSNLGVMYLSGTMKSWIYVIVIAQMLSTEIIQMLVPPP
jgi:hypothetical protein